MEAIMPKRIGGTVYWIENGQQTIKAVRKSQGLVEDFTGFSLGYSESGGYKAEYNVPEGTGGGAKYPWRLGHNPMVVAWGEASPP
jgi:hypothetical protein